MSYFGNVSSFPCLEFTAAFSRNQAFFDARNDFPLFPQSTISHFGHFAETFPISPGIPAIRTRPRPNAHVIGSQCAHRHGPLRGFPPVTIRFPLAPTLGELAAKPTERVNTLSPPRPGTFPRGRDKALIRLALAGDARATFPQGKAGRADRHTSVCAFSECHLTRLAAFSYNVKM